MINQNYSKTEIYLIKLSRLMRGSMRQSAFVMERTD